MRVIAATLAVILAVSAPLALAQAPTADALKQIIEGNLAYLDWPVMAGDRERIDQLYQDTGYRLLWSDGEKPTAAANSLLQELRQAGDRGLDPDDYPSSRLAGLLTDLLGAPHSEAKQWAPIIVNIPQFRLFALESTIDSEALTPQMDVIVGKAFEARETPVFSAGMTYVVFRPYWEVPYSIALKEIVPGARRDPSYIERHHMEIVSGFGEAPMVVPNTPENVELIAKGALRVRQKPGPDNSLGLVKFMLPNRYNVYLHSTPAKALFGESRRDFSHGCVRVSDPVGLAQYVLRDSPEWTRDRILAAMNGADSLTVTLKKPIRVFIVYGTALANEQGEILFFDDIYRHDERLLQALNARREHTLRRTAAATTAPP